MSKKELTVRTVGLGLCGGGCSWEAADEHGYLPKSLHPASCEYRKMCYEMAFDLISRHSSSQEKNQREATVSE